MNTIQFELVSPEQRLMDEPTVMAVIPGEEGDVGVLNGHAPVLTTIRPGVINIYKNDMNTVTDQLFLAGGFADITPDRVTVLAEEAYPLTQIDRAETETKIKDLKADRDSAETENEKARYEARLLIEEAKLDALSAAA